MFQNETYQPALAAIRVFAIRPPNRINTAYSNLPRKQIDRDGDQNCISAIAAASRLFIAEPTSGVRIQTEK